MDLSDFSDERDKAIVCFLRYGERRRKEIIKIVNDPPSTVDNHLEYLVENYEQIKSEKRGEKAFYHLDLEDGPLINPVQPRPHADRRVVRKLLNQIHEDLQFLSGHDSLEGVYPTEDMMDTVQDFYNEAGKVYVLDSDQRLDRYFDCFDELLKLLPGYPIGNTPLYEYFRDILETSQILLDNWELNMEHSEYRLKLIERTGDLFEKINPEAGVLALRLVTILKRLDIGRAKDATINLSTSQLKLPSRMEEAREYSRLVHETFGMENDLDEFLEKVENKKHHVDDESAGHLDKVARQIRKDYTKDSFN